jgi:putative tryptophan/tyrosine transport system substrate-binding protein
MRRRREFITVLGSVAAWLLAGDRPHIVSAAQAIRVPWIALLAPQAEGDKSISQVRIAFERALRDLGWIAGRNVRIEYRFAGGVLARLSMLAKEVSDLHPDVIVALHTATVALVLRETRTIPIVFGWVVDPVGSGFVQSHARPGGNATGVAFDAENLASKWLELLKEISPETTRVAVLFHPDTSPGHGDYYMRPFEDAAPLFAITPIAAPVRNPDDIARVISGLEGQPLSGFIVTPDYFVGRYYELIITLAARHRVPAVYFFPDFSKIGGLLSYGPDQPLGPQLAYYVDRILKGAAPAELPVQEPTKFKLVINLKTAKALGLTVPVTLLARADEVIE